MAISSNKATRFVYLRTLPLKKLPELADDVDSIAEQIDAATLSLCEKHLSTVVDDRAAVHLHTAALAIATHRVVSPRIKNDIRLTNLIRAGFGAALLPDPTDTDDAASNHAAAEQLRPDFWIVRAALWFSWDRMSAVRKMTANMARDFGASFQTESRDAAPEGRKEHTFIVSTFMPPLNIEISKPFCRLTFDNPSVVCRTMLL